MQPAYHAPSVNVGWMLVQMNELQRWQFGASNRPDFKIPWTLATVRAATLEEAKLKAIAKAAKSHALAGSAEVHVKLLDECWK